MYQFLIPQVESCGIIFFSIFRCESTPRSAGAEIKNFGILKNSDDIAVKFVFTEQKDFNQI